MCNTISDQSHNFLQRLSVTSHCTTAIQLINSKACSCVALSPRVEWYSRQNNLTFQILLLLDNVAGHPDSLWDLTENANISFLPPNVTSSIQLMDQGVISTFEVYYIDRLLRLQWKIMQFLSMDFGKNMAESMPQKIFKHDGRM